MQFSIISPLVDREGIEPSASSMPRKRFRQSSTTFLPMNYRPNSRTFSARNK
jgi:hypothetical protein